MLGSTKRVFRQYATPLGPSGCRQHSPEAPKTGDVKRDVSEVTSDWLGGGLKLPSSICSMYGIFTYYVVVLKYLLFNYFHHYLGKITILTHIFGRGWNHHLAAYSEKEKKIEANLTKKDSADS